MALDSRIRFKNFNCNRVDVQTEIGGPVHCTSAATFAGHMLC